jgi:2-polyprenyl-3-methyl-5-hydroxy-6-metoxy-1,4-benzoquinol methylase
MADKVEEFYEELADCYHLIYEDWDRSIERQAATLNSLLASHLGNKPLRVLDCACGIGTQSIGLAQLGHHVLASDLSQSAVNRAKKEAQQRNLDIEFHLSDMTSLKEIERENFDAAIAIDNALPHIDRSQLGQAATAIASKLRPNGIFIASIRDYDTLNVERPTSQPPAFWGKPGSRRIVHQIWDWTDEPNGEPQKTDPSYRLHLYITVESPQGWKAHHFVSRYRWLLREELSSVLRGAGFNKIRWLMPAESGFYQPLVLARLA